MSNEFQVVYHGSDHDIQGNNFDTDIVYFSGRKEFAEEFGKVVKSYKVLLKNPYHFDKQSFGCYHDDEGKMPLDEDGHGISIGYLSAHMEIVDALISQGYDGAVDGDEFIVIFDNEQIIPLDLG